MLRNAKKILVPTDFTRVGEAALEHGIKMALVIGAEVHVLHIIVNKKDISEARLKMQTLSDKIEKEHCIQIYPIIRIGNIFEDIDKVGTEIDTDLIFMGTHGIKGMQHITGSRALKIVTKSNIPFVIVQEKGVRETGYDDIVVPLDLHRETKQKLAIVADMAKYFNSQVHLISPGETDTFLKNQLTRNINFAKQFLEEKGIANTVTVTRKKSSAFVKEVIKEATARDADLISIMNLYENSLMGIFGQSYEEQMITNESQIPILCINPVETTVVKGSVFTT